MNFLMDRLILLLGEARGFGVPTGAVPQRTHLDFVPTCMLHPGPHWSDNHAVEQGGHLVNYCKRAQHRFQADAPGDTASTAILPGIFMAKPANAEDRWIPKHGRSF